MTVVFVGDGWSIARDILVYVPANGLGIQYSTVWLSMTDALYLPNSNQAVHPSSVLEGSSRSLSDNDSLY